VHSSRAQALISSRWITDNTPTSELCSRLLPAQDAATLKLCLIEDGLGYAYSALISLGEAFHGIEKSLSTWATVKLYYASFYAVRAILAIEGKCIFYKRSLPFYLDCQPGASPVKKAGTTHKAVLHAFVDHGNPNFFLSQTIEGENPLFWLMNKREEVNYKFAGFIEPIPLDHFDGVLRHGVRRSIKSYLGSEGDYLMFDKDHAMVALPLRLCAKVTELYKVNGNWTPSDESVTCLQTLFSDSRGKLPEMWTLI
jgi:hypothetical protein